MPPRMMTRSAGRATVTPRGGRTDGWTGKGGGRTRGRSGDQGNGEIDGQGGQVGAQVGVQVGGQVGGQGNKVNDVVPDLSTIIAQQLQNLLPTIVAQVGDQGRNQGNGSNQNGDAINDNIKGDVRNVIADNNQRGYTYKEFLACNPKEYDGKGGAIVYTRWIEKMESVQDMSGCEVNQKVNYTTGLFVSKALTWWNSQIHIESQEAAIENGSIKKNHAKRRNREEPSKDRNVRDNNKRTRTGNAFAITTNPVGRENTGNFAKDCRVIARNVNPVNAINPAAARGACYECGSTDHYKSAYPRLNRAQGPGGNRPNQALANNEGQGRGNQGNQARGRAFMLGAEEARQDPNIVTGTFTLNDHYATTLFNFGADYSFVSTTFIPLLGIEPSDLGFSYEIEIASGQLVEIDKVIKGCKLEIDGDVFDINLIPFESRSFDVIIGMDWLSDYKDEIICHEKVVRIPLLDSKVLRVLGEKTRSKDETVNEC
ncbi:putative reverse transcriptase domain-containing protein [Tanacetum coccineum]